MRNRAFRFLFTTTTILYFFVVYCLSPAGAQTNAVPKNDGGKLLLSIAVFSDTHVIANWNREARLSQVKFESALQDIRPFKPGLLVINGDLTNGARQDYQKLLELYHKNANYPLIPAMGNHDYYYEWFDKKWTDNQAQEQFKSFFHLHSLYHDQYIKGVHLIWLCPEQYMPLQKKIGEAAWLSPKQIEWFRQTLLKDEKSPTFVFLHQPLDDTVADTDPGLSAVQTKELLAIAREHPQLVWFSSHSHISSDTKTEVVKKDGVLFVGTGSVYAPEEPVTSKGGTTTTYRANLAKSESRFVDVYTDRIVIRTRHHHNGTWGSSYLIPLKTPLPTLDYYSKSLPF